MNECPMCKRPLGGDWQRRDGATFNLGGADLVLPGTSFERRMPARSADLGADVAVPAMQAAITGVVGGVVGVLIGGWQTGGVVGGAVFCGSWLLLLADHRSLLWSVERVTGRDLDGDRQVGVPEARRVRVEIAQKHSGGQSWRWLDLPVTEDKLHDVARAVLHRGVPFSRRGLSGVLSQTEYETLAAVMVTAGLLVELPGNRRELAVAGRAMLRQFV